MSYLKHVVESSTKTWWYLHCYVCRIQTLWRPLLPYGYTVIKHFVPDRVKPSLVIFDIRALWRSGLSVRVPGCQTLQVTAYPAWHRMLC